MKLRFEVNQAESFRLGIDRPKSIVSLEVNPADLSEGNRAIIANHLVGIDVVEFFYHDGEVIKGYPIRELSYTSREPRRITAKSVNMEALLQAIMANDRSIELIEKSFDKPVQFHLIDKPPINAKDYAFVSEQGPNRIEEVLEAIRQKRRVTFQHFIHNVQTDLNKALHANSYVVYLLLVPGSTAQGRFYCEPVFAADFQGRFVLAHSPTIVLNEKTGRIFETRDLFQAVDVYLFCGVSGSSLNALSILSWTDDRWTIVEPEGLIDMANERGKKTGPE